jgi:cytosine/adenosine deaminase-related metal-dependent hydrolase
MSLLLRRLSHVVTFDGEDRELRDADILIEKGVVVAVGQDLPAENVGRVIDGTGLLALPGLINAHQHLYQGALRCLPEIQRAAIVPWLAGLGATGMKWWNDGQWTVEMIRRVSRAVLTESLLGGVTTTADQYYFFPGGRTEPYIEASIEAASEVGVRLHAGRGSMTLGRANGGTANDFTVQTVEEVLRHSVELIEKYHDPNPLAKVRVMLAPCGVSVDAPALFEEMAELAASYEGVRLHTHLYEKFDAQACQSMYGMTPWQFLVEHGWAGSRTWIAHVVDPPEVEIAAFAETGVGIAHLAAPDLRMGWGVAPIRRYLDAGVKVGFGTTGSASNDGSNMLGDLRVAALAHRPAIAEPNQWPSARELLGMATRGSAICLGRPDLGVIAPGMAADIACWDLRTVDRIGVHDPVEGLLMTGLSNIASLVLVAGEVLVEDGHPTRLDPDAVARAAREVIPAYF